MGLKSTEQGRNERMQEDYSTLAKSTQQMQGILLAFFDLHHVSLLFAGPSLNEMKFTETFFSSSVLLWKFLNHIPNKRLDAFTLLEMNTFRGRIHV